MKKLIVSIALVTLSSSTWSATSAELILKGNVAPVLDISLAHEPTASALDLANAAASVKVATLTEKSNYATGYKVSAKSTNGGKLVNVVDQNSFVPYTLTYNGSTVPLLTSPSQVYTTATIRGTHTKELKISYNKPSDLSAGSYEDSVQFTISAN